MTLECIFGSQMDYLALAPPHPDHQPLLCLLSCFQAPSDARGLCRAVSGIARPRDQPSSPAPQNGVATGRPEPVARGKTHALSFKCPGSDKPGSPWPLTVSPPTPLRESIYYRPIPDTYREFSRPRVLECSHRTHFTHWNRPLI